MTHPHSRSTALAPALALLLLLAGAGASAGDRPLQAGDYATAQGWGDLRLEPAGPAESLGFALETVSNEHVCSIVGQVDVATGIALPEDTDAAPGCVLHLQATANGVQVEPASPAAALACRHYCGSHGSYDGHYLAIPAACTWPALQAAKTAARAAGTALQRRDALATLSPLPGRCGATMNLEQRVDLHATLAGLHAANGNAPACRAALADYAPDAARSDEELTDGASPAWARAQVAAMAQVRQALARCAVKPLARPAHPG